MPIETIWVDTHSDYLPAYTESTAVLESGQTYVIEVHGNFAWWINNVVPYGQVDDVIYETASQARADVAAMDAETIYADILDRPLPRHQDPGSTFVMNLGSGFSHHHPDGGQTSTPDPEHRYTYTLVGEGYPLQAAIDGGNAGTNGILRVQIDTPNVGWVIGRVGPTW